MQDSLQKVWMGHEILHFNKLPEVVLLLVPRPLGE